jgi:hypothetical protein
MRDCRSGFRGNIAARLTMSALPPKADMIQRGRDVRFVPIPDKVRGSKITLFDHLVG